MKKYLALGDSYTIGEQLPMEENFPNQLNDILNQNGILFAKPQIIAVTGWTTDELACEIATKKPATDHNLVTLLIGVNNQYRGRDEAEYYWHFYSLLCQAILFANSAATNVVVLSIPDWGLTPFNTTRDKTETSAQIDTLNRINKEISDHMGVHYVDVTGSSRLHATDPLYLAPDQLHYSAAEYALWAKEVSLLIP